MSTSPSRIPLDRLDAWWNDQQLARRTVRISGGLRGQGLADTPHLPLLELKASPTSTVRILVPETPPVVAKGTPDAAQFDQADSAKGKWWGGWSKVLSATALVPPVVDPKRLAELLQDSRRLRFYCDTNALAGGVADWLLFVFQGRADLVTSAVVDRELAAWPDRDNALWNARSVERWAKRTQYRLARRITENPPPGVVIDRLSPEQGALMLAKLRDETEGKSPDADTLLIELARGLVRDQPRQARVIYLTGDRNNARAATSALGPEHVLFAVADGETAHEHLGTLAVPGWWSPSGPLGSVRLMAPSRILWGLLAACDFLRLEVAGDGWLLQPALSVTRGVPSDWAEPWVEITRLASPEVPVPPEPPPPPSVVPPEPSPPQEAPSGRVRRRRVLPIWDRLDADEWLLPPQPLGPPVELAGEPTFFHGAFFALLWKVFTEDPAAIAEFVGSLRPGIQSHLVALGALDASGGPGARIPEFREAWETNNLDWFHAELFRIRQYRAAIKALSIRPNLSSGPSEDYVSMARLLGQVAARIKPEEGYFLGDAPVRAQDLLRALHLWLSSPGATAPTTLLCTRAALELRLTPARFERAMERLWTLHPDIPFEGSTGGTVEPGQAENVVHLDSAGYHLRKVSPETLSFGRKGPVRFITRTR
jgi:hypothetical protein